jgi:hypothetical protein
VTGVRSAIHVRTGTRASTDAIDAWLSQHQVAVVPFDDVYAACAHLLKNFAQIPDLVFVGTDWLSRDELGIVPYVRQTWSRTGIVVYGEAAETPPFDWLPLVLMCRGKAALDAVLAAPPASVVRRLDEQLRPSGPNLATLENPPRQPPGRARPAEPFEEQ